ncbi:MAG: RNA polymerase sigma-70 factor [Phaeodactylibacter sp.]|nr:RNA polymerase sigma-70 factor [Phaeodactylibacter sp.]MCB9273432.1 RNA polymerase sigma-70 factor [Lewinellaceae bacterium]
MSIQQTEDILKRLKSDDRSALKDLFQSYYQPVCQAINRFIRDPGTTEDLAQEVFLRFWEKRHSIEVSSSLPAYLRRMAINEALGYLRRNKRYEEDEFDPSMEPGEEASAEGQYLHTELEQSVRNAIDTLPPKCRAVFQLSRFEELTYNEIADQMGISVKTVENQMGKALRLLRERLQGYLNILL